MIVCHCMQVTDHEIRAAVGWMRGADPDTIITPGKIYRALGKRADCGGCLSLFVELMQTSEGFACAIQTRGLRRATRQEHMDEGRPQGHRVSQRGIAE